MRVQLKPEKKRKQVACLGGVPYLYAYIYIYIRIIQVQIEACHPKLKVDRSQLLGFPHRGQWLNLSWMQPLLRASPRVLLAPSWWKCVVLRGSRWLGVSSAVSSAASLPGVCGARFHVEAELLGD